MVSPPVFCEHLRLQQGEKELLVQQFVPEAAIQGFDVWGFAMEPPGSIKAAPVPEKQHQSAKACEVSSGPLSKRMKSGASNAGRDQFLKDLNGPVSGDLSVPLQPPGPPG